MTRPNLTQRAHALEGFAHAAAVLGAVVLSGAAALAAVTAQSGAGALSWWWPASGVGVAAVLLAKPSARPIALLGFPLITAAAAFSADRPLAIVMATGLSALLEASIVLLVLRRATGEIPGLTSVPDVGRLLGAAALAGAAGGTTLGLAAGLLGADVLDTSVRIAASHGSAIAIIAPLALIHRLRRPTAAPGVVVGYTVAVALAVILVFMPTSASPLAFVPLPLLAWAAFTQSMSAAYLQSLLAMVLGWSLTAMGRGPFVAPAGGFESGTLLQIWALSLVITSLAIGAASLHRRQLEEQRAGLTGLLHDAFARARNGFLLVRETTPGSFDVIEANAAAHELLGESELVEFRGRLRFGPKARIPALISAQPEGGCDAMPWENETGGEPIATIAIERITHHGVEDVHLVHVVDQRPLREAERVMERRLAREREVAETLREMNQRTDDFVASVSHELRTPMTSITGYVEELEVLTLDPEPREYVEVISRNTRRMVELVDNVLTVSRENHHTAARSQPELWEVDTLVTQCVDDVHYQLASRHLRVRREIEPGLQIYGADAEIVRVIGNLVSNAIKFSPTGGEIVVGGRLEDALVIEVADEGPGVTAEEGERVFEKFYRSPSAIEAGIGGTGLGLAIVRDLVTRMGGEVTLGPGPERGAVATVRLPASQAAPALRDGD